MKFLLKLMAIRLLKFGILLLAFGLINFNLFAQEKSCDLQFGIYEFKEDGTSEQFPVSDAKIELINEKTKETLTISRKAIANLIQGDYLVFISKDGFRKTKKSFSLSCEFKNYLNTVSEIVFLWEGDSNQIFDMNSNNSDNVELTEVKSTEEKEKPTAIFLAKPQYPSEAKKNRERGQIEVEVTINEIGYVISAKAIKGNSIFYSAGVEAALKSKFQMTFLKGIPIKVTGIIVYNFAP